MTSIQSPRWQATADADVLSRPNIPAAVLRRRRTLPGSRAVVGGLLVTVAAIGTFTAFTSATTPNLDEFVVVRRDLPAGTRLAAADLRVAEMDLPDQLSRKGAFRSQKALIGATTTASLSTGELVQASSVVFKASPSTSVELTLALEPARAAGGALAPDERVDVLATYGSGAESYTVVVVQNARIVARQQESRQLGATSNVNVAIAVANRIEAAAVTNAVDSAKVSLVRTTGVPPSSPSAPYRPSDGS